MDKFVSRQSLPKVKKNTPSKGSSDEAKVETLDDLSKEPSTKRVKLDPTATANTEGSASQNESPLPTSSSSDSAFSDFEHRLQEKRLGAAKSILEFPFKKERVRMISRCDEFPERVRAIAYWMCRDSRVQDNWALLYAQRLALKYKARLFVCFCVLSNFSNTSYRIYHFLLNGLKEVERDCKALNIPFFLFLGEAKDRLPKFIKKHEVDGIVCDFFPLRGPLKWIDDLKNALPENIPFCQVDAHNVVPVWVASDSLQYAARTIRPRIWKHVPEFLTEFPPLIKHPFNDADVWKSVKPTDWTAPFDALTANRSVREVTWAIPGTSAGLKTLDEFCRKRLLNYGEHRNDPNKNALSNLSPWFHFGQIAPQRAILTVLEHKKKPGYKESVDAFVEEAMIRRELSDNFCFYNKDYDNLKGAWEWARTTLNAHRKDKRPHLYTREQLERGETGDPLWNASQMQLVQEGKMHGFMRMYWAKKILEWTASPEEALEISIFLNDHYSLDGRDPSGYVGCMWSICGVHDQGWAERAIFGKIRYMNYKGCQRKFNVAAYEMKYRKVKPRST